MKIGNIFKQITVRGIFKRLSLLLFLICSVTILAESAVDGTGSANKSNSITDIVQDVINENHDNNTIIDISDFSISFDKSSTIDSFHPGDSLSFSISYFPENTSYQGIDIVSSDTNVVTIDQDEKKLNFINEGTSIVSFTSTKKEELKKTFSFIVEHINIEEIRLQETSLSLKVNDTYQLNPIILPENVTNSSIYYESSDENIASVNRENGLIKAIAAGECDVFVKSTNNPDIFTKTHLVITPLEDIVYEITSISVPSNIGVLTLNKISTLVRGTYDSIHANFDINLLNISISNSSNYLTISQKRWLSAGFFEFKVSLNTSNSALNDVDNYVIKIDISYNNSFKQTTQVTINKLRTIVYENLDSNQNSYKFYYTKFEQYDSLNNIKKDDAVIKVKFVQSFKAIDYNQKNFKWDVEESIKSKFKVLSSSYNTLKLSPLSSSTVSGSVIYYPNKLDLSKSITINFTYEDTTSDSKIESISLKKIEKTGTTLIKDHPYVDFLAYKIHASGSNAKNNSYLENSTILYKINDSNLAEISYNLSTNKYTLTPKSVGELHLFIYSDIENTILGAENATKYEYVIEIKENIANYAKFVLNEETYDYDKIPSEINIDRDETISFGLLSYYKNAFLDGTSDLIETSSDFTFNVSNNNGSLHIIEETATLIGIKASDEPMYLNIFSAINGLKTLTIKINVIYIPIKIECFSLTFYSNIEGQEYNSPSEDYTNIPVNYEFFAKSVVNEDATNKGVSFYSSDENILEISKTTGLAKTKKTGVADIVCISNDNPNILVTKTINVLNTASDFKIIQNENGFNPLSLEEIKDNDGKFLYYKAKLDYGRPYKLTITPDYNSTSTSYKYEHKNTKDEDVTSKVISIDSSGSITTNTIGEDWIKVTYGYKDSIKSYSKYVQIEVMRNTYFTYSELSHIVRKSLGHFGLFAVTAFFSVAFIFLAFKCNKYKFFSLFISSLIGIFLAVGSELIQYVTPGRCCAVQDMMIDSAGYLLTITLAAILILLMILTKRLYNYIKRKKLEKNNKPS